MDAGGKIDKLFNKYVDDRFTLKQLVNHELSEKTREERISIRSVLLNELSKFSEQKTLSEDAFKKVTADFLSHDLQYCEKMQYQPDHFDFMTEEDLSFEEKKLRKMIKLIIDEKKFRAIAPKIKIFRNVVRYSFWY